MKNMYVFHWASVDDYGDGINADDDDVFTR